MRRLLVFLGSLFMSGFLWAGSLTISGSGFLNLPTLQNAPYAANCGDIVLASATPSGVTITLPSATSCNGSPVVISKMDTSTAAVTVLVNGTDVVAGTGTLTLNAFGQTDSIVGTTAGTWVPWGQGLQLTPPYLVARQIDNGTSGVTTSSDTIVCSFYNLIPVSVTGFHYVMQATGGTGSANFGIYDQNGVLLTSANKAVAATGLQTLSMTPYNLPPGQYYLGVQLSNSAMTITGGSTGSTAEILCSKQGATSMTLPNPFTFGTSAAKSFAVYMLVAGGRQAE